MPRQLYRRDDEETEISSSLKRCQRLCRRTPNMTSDCALGSSEVFLNSLHFETEGQSNKHGAESDLSFGPRRMCNLQQRNCPILIWRRIVQCIKVRSWHRSRYRQTSGLPSLPYNTRMDLVAALTGHVLIMEVSCRGERST